jgi:hypothetical protein
MTADVDVVIREATPVYALGEFEHCVLTVWRLQPTEEAFRRRNRELLDLASRFPGQCAYMEFIEQTSRPPPGALRPVSLEPFPGLGKNLSCIGTTIDGTQVRSALVRAILTGMTFLVPQFQPYKVFKRRSDMAEWVQPRINAAPGFADRVTAAFEVLRSAPDSRGSDQGTPGSS